MWCVHVETQARNASPSHPSLLLHVHRAGADKSITCLSQCVPAFLHNVCRLMCKVSNHVPDFYSFIFIFFVYFAAAVHTLDSANQFDSRRENGTLKLQGRKHNQYKSATK